MSNLRDYNQEAPIHHLIARHWDALEIEAVCRSLLAAVPKQQLENFLVADSLQREKVQAYFAAFKDQPLEYLHAQFHLFYDLKYILQIKFLFDFHLEKTIFHHYQEQLSPFYLHQDHLLYKF